MDTSKLQIIKQRYNVVGNCDALNRALDVALQVAPTDLSVLIIGESGVGKEIIPRVIHDNSPRKREKYFAINCGSIPEGTIDSELFGHEKGYLHGCHRRKRRILRYCQQGYASSLTRWANCPIQTQARLLRVLETGEYIRVGGTEIRKTDVRIVAATNVNMRKAVSEGRFREDLYYRLNTIPIQMPALRERGRRHPPALPPLRHADGRKIHVCLRFHSRRRGQADHAEIQVAGKRATAQEHYRTDVSA